jgi:hypothetical protein
LRFLKTGRRPAACASASLLLFRFLNGSSSTSCVEREQ